MPKIRPLSIELAKKAELELNEKPERIEADLQALREWLAKTPHLKSRTDDQFLIVFLRGCKYSLERAKDKLDMYYSTRSALSEIYIGREPHSSAVHDLLRKGVIIPLPQTDTPDGPRVVIFRPGFSDPEVWTPMKVFCIVAMLMDIMFLEDDNFVVAGIVLVMDFSNFIRGHFLQLTPMVIKKISLLNQEANPIRQKGGHYIHLPDGFMIIFNIFMKFMNEKNRKRMNIHGENIDAMFEKIPKRIFPTEYGGEAGSIESIMEYWVKKVESYADYFIEEEQYGTDETKRPGGEKRDAESLFGLEGSFRKLEVD